MSGLDELYRLPDDFRGAVRLFPLPNLVLFPHVLQPLHVFEARYRALAEEALATDQLICLANLQPGWEADYEGRPPLLPIGCLGRIVSHHRLEDGRLNLLLAGLRRVRLTKELPPLRPFREARVELMEDHYASTDATTRSSLLRRLIEAFRRVVPQASQLQEQFQQLLGAELPLGTLTDIIAYTLDLPLEFKVQLLAETNVDRRAVTLVDRLESTTLPSHLFGGGHRPFPPSFSEN